MSFYLNSFACIDIYTFTAINPYQFKCSQPLDFHVLIILQSLFYQQKKLPTKTSASF